jgi:hypothetical protein
VTVSLPDQQRLRLSAIAADAPDRRIFRPGHNFPAETLAKAPPMSGQLSAVGEEAKR